MNARRRKEIEKLTAQIEEIMSAIDYLREEEQEAYDNLPESFQDGEQGDRMTDAIEKLEYAYDILQDAYDNLCEATE